MVWRYVRVYGARAKSTKGWRRLDSAVTFSSFFVRALLLDIVCEQVRAVSILNPFDGTSSRRRGCCSCSSVQIARKVATATASSTR